MTARSELFAFLDAVTYTAKVTVYDIAEDLIKLPAILIDEADPVVLPSTMGRNQFNFDVALIVPRTQTREQLLNMEVMRQEVIDALHGTQWKWAEISKSTQEDYGDLAALVSRVVVTTRLQEGVA